MDYEKKYKEALELARVAAFNGHQSLMEGIFPELAESKDEKTRKRIIALVNAHGQGMYKDDMLAWLENIPYTIDHEKREGFHLGYKAALEKQAEQKPFDYENADIQQKDFAPKETVKEAESNLTPLERKVKDILFSFHINAADGISFDGTMAIVHNLITLCQQEQKPAWSEGDDVLLSSVINSLLIFEDSGASKMKIDWLTSIKQRIKGE